MVGCQAGTEELTNAIVREAVIWLNTNLAELKKTVPNESESPAPRESFSPDELVEKISTKLNSQKGAQGAMQQLLCWTRCNSKCSSEEDSVLSSTVGDSMTVVISTIESSLDEQSSVCKPAKCLLSTIRQAEKTLACQSSSLSDVFLSDTDLYGGSVESITQAGGQTQAVQPGMQALYSGEFLLKANKAVSSVLVIKMKQFDSAPSSATYLCATDTRASVAISRSETEHSPEVYLKHADAAASEIVDQFARDLQMCVESLQSLSISNKSDLGSPEGQGKGSEMKLGSLESAQDIPKKEFTSAALTMYQSVQGKVREFFPRLYFNRKQQYEHLEEIPSKDDIFDQSKATPALSGPLSESEDLPVTTDLQDCTNEVMGELLMAVKEQIAEDQTSCTEGKITPAGSYLAVNIMLELENNLCLSTSGHSLQSSAEKQGSGTPSILSPGSTASDLVGTVVGIQTLLQSTGYDAMDTDSKGNSKGDSAVSLDKSQVEVEASKVKIWSATKGMFGSLQGKVKDLFTKSQQHGSKVEDKASAEEAISNVIIGTEKDVPEFGPWEHVSEDLQRFHDTINAVFQRFGKVDVQQPASASSSAPKRKLSPLNQETLPGVLPIFSEIPSESPFTNIDSDGADDLDDAAVDESAAGITRDTMVDVVKAILEKVDLRDPSSSHAQGLTSVAQSLERFLSSSSVNSSSQDLIDHIYGLFMRSNNTTPEQCASDTVLLNQGQRKESGIPVASQILHIYIEESVKHLFLSCFKLPSPWSVNKDSSLQPAQTSNSCPGSPTDMASNYQDKMAATKSPSQILSDTVCLVNTMMVKEVINSLTVALSSNHNLEGSIQDQSTLSTSALITSGKLAHGSLKCLNEMLLQHNIIQT